ncbi:MAG: hemolysin family protein [Chthoniobacterales bacterium]|nr:hemolysin family protein [Chthoniobacterales bacterium]
MIFFIKNILEPLIFIFIGGVFILADVCLGMRKDHVEKIFFLRSSRPALRFTAVFFFVLGILYVGENFLTIPSSTTALEHLLILVVLSALLALFLSLFGIALPRIVAESYSSSWFVYGLSCFVQGATCWMRPVIAVFHFCLLPILKCLGLSLYTTPPTSDEEVIHMMDEGLHSGIFNAAEKEMVEGVLELDEQCAASLMTPRSQVIALNLDDKDEENWRHIISSGHSEFPVFKTTQDNVVGMVSVKALWANLSMTGAVKLADVITKPLYLSSTMSPSAIIEEFRSKKCHMALVVNEFGIVVGIITLKDVIESIVGVLPERENKMHYPQIVVQTDKSWLVDAMMNYKEAAEELGMSPRDEENEENRYQTMGGFFLHHLGHIPHAGESVTVGNFYFQVVSMKQHRIDKLSVAVLPASQVEVKS